MYNTHRYRTNTAQIPHKYRTHTTQIPHKYRTHTTQIPHKYRTNTTQIPHTYRRSTAQIPQKYRRSTAQIPQKYRRSTAQIPHTYRRSTAQITRDLSLLLTPGSVSGILELYMNVRLLNLILSVTYVVSKLWSTNSTKFLSRVPKALIVAPQAQATKNLAFPNPLASFLSYSVCLFCRHNHGNVRVLTIAGDYGWSNSGSQCEYLFIADPSLKLL